MGGADVLEASLVDAPAIAEAQLRSAGRSPLLAAARRPGVALSGLVLVAVVAWALAPKAFTSWDPLVGIPAQRLQAPSGNHPFGTDQLGRDLLARVVHGSSLSLLATLTAVSVALLLGSTLGLVAGFVGGRIDDAIMRVVDVLLAIPGLLLSLALVTALGFGTVNVAIAVGVATAANFARVMRSEVLRVRTGVFVEAARISGVRWYGVLLRHVLPNATGPVVVMAALEFGTAILAVSALSFLGFGAAPPAPEWGSLVAGGRNHMATAWWLTTLPGLVVAAKVLSANRLSRAVEGVSHSD
jgi:peptide/nickel transport system permease protein